MEDQWGNTIQQTVSGDGLYWVFTRFGNIVQYPRTMDLDVATTNAIDTFNGMEPME